MPKSHHTQKLKWFMHINVIAKTIKPLEKYIEVKLNDLGLGSDFLYMHWKHNWQKKKQINYISSKLKTLSLNNIKKLKGTTHRMREYICKLYIS